jgi:hypothetical protein
MYVLERDSKTIFEYNLKLNKVFRKSIDMPSRFEHNFQYIQTPSNRLFLIGGGDLNKNLQKLVATFEVINNGTSTFDILPKD